LAEIFGSEHLIIQTAFLGDLLLGLPFFREIKKRHPKDKIVLLCRKGLGSFVLNLGLVDEVIEVDKGNRESWRRAVRQLVAREFAIAFCPHQSFRSLALLARLKAQKKIGYRVEIPGGIGRLISWGLFSAAVPRPMDLPESLRQLALLQALDEAWREKLIQFGNQQGIKGGQETESQLLSVPEWASMTCSPFQGLQKGGREKNLELLSVPVRKLYQEMKGDQKALILLAPGSVWKTKRWTLNGYVELARRFVESGYAVGIIGAPDEQELALKIQEEAPGSFSMAGKTNLGESLEILATATLLVCNDSGAMHMASLTATPTVAVFGPTVLEFGYRPWQNKARVVQVSRSQLSCRPCGKHGAQECPIGTHACMKNVSSNTVYEVAMTLIGQN
jgi:heptosyltransferase II